MNEDMDLDGVLMGISRLTDPRQLEKLRLLISSVIPFGLVDGKTVQEIYYEIDSHYTTQEGIGLLKYLLGKAGLPQAKIASFTPFVTPAEDRNPLSMLSRDELRNLFFHELLVSVANHVGDGHYFKQLRYRIPRNRLTISCDDHTIPNCVRLLQILVQENILNPDREHLEQSLRSLEQWLGDSGRTDVGNIVSRKKSELVRGRLPFSVNLFCND